MKINFKRSLLCAIAFIVLPLLAQAAGSAARSEEVAPSMSCSEAEDSWECVASKRTIAALELKATFAAVKARIQETANRLGDAQSKKDGLEIERRLNAAQAAWLVSRDASCSLEGASALGGKIEGLVIDGCLLDRTAARIAELRDLDL